MDNFEDFLKNEAHDFKMQPSEKVWNGVQSAISTPKRIALWWYSAAAIVLISGLSLLYIHFGTRNILQNNTAISSEQYKANNNKPSVGESPIIPDEKPVPENSKPGQGKDHNASGNAGNRNKAHRLIGAESHHKTEDKTIQASDKSPKEDDIKEFTKAEMVSSMAQKQVSYASVSREIIIQRTKEGISALSRDRAIPKRKNTLDYLISVGMNISNPIGSTSFKNFIKPSTGFGLGFSAIYNFGSHWGIIAGIGYQQHSYKIGAVSIAPEKIYIANAMQDSLPQDANYKLSNESQNRNIIRQLILPLAFQYRKDLGHRNSVSIFTGVDITKTIGSRYLIKNASNDRLFSNRDFIAPMNTYLSIGANYTCILNNNLRLLVGYKIQYQLNNTFNHDYYLKENLLVNGINIGIVF